LSKLSVISMGFDPMTLPMNNRDAIPSEPDGHKKSPGDCLG
jgi:hypothetical protein